MKFNPAADTRVALQAAAATFLPEADTATLPYRIGVWRVLARAARTEGDRRDFCDRIPRMMTDPQIGAANGLLHLLP
jgi:hypothetical protein